MSGGRATVNAKKGKGLSHAAGDICAIHPEGAWLTDTFFIEAKHYKDPAWHKFFLTSSGPIQDFWTKVVEQSAEHKKKPLLIVRQNMYPTQVVVSSKQVRKLSSIGDHIIIKHRFLHVITFESLLKIDPKELLT